jgi:hypothetical protein
MNEPLPSTRLALVLTVVIVVLTAVLAIVALNNATYPEVAMPVALALAAGLLGLGIALRRT